MGSRPERGAYGNARGKESQKRRREARMKDPRVVAALEEVKQHQQLIDALAAQPVEGPGRPTLKFEKPEPAPEPLPEVKPAPDYHAPGRVVIKPSTKLDIKWNVRDVYLLIKSGYEPDYICKRTGYEPDVVAAIIEDILNEEEEGGEGDAEEQDRDVPAV